MRVDDVCNYLMQNIQTDIFPYGKVLDWVTQGDAVFAKPTFHAIVKHVDDVPLHLKLFGGILCDEKTALEAHDFLRI